MCKQDTRNAFDEFKRVLNVELFPYNDNIKNDLQTQLTQGMCAKTVKYFVMNNKLSEYHIKFMCNVTEHYKQIALKTSENYCKRFTNIWMKDRKPKDYSNTITIILIILAIISVLQLVYKFT